MSQSFPVLLPYGLQYTQPKPSAMPTLLSIHSPSMTPFSPVHPIVAPLSATLPQPAPAPTSPSAGRQLSQGRSCWSLQGSGWPWWPQCPRWQHWGPRWSLQGGGGRGSSTGGVSGPCRVVVAPLAAPGGPWSPRGGAGPGGRTHPPPVPQVSTRAGRRRCGSRCGRPSWPWCASWLRTTTAPPATTSWGSSRCPCPACAKVGAGATPLPSGDGDNPLPQAEPPSVPRVPPHPPALQGRCVPVPRHALRACSMQEPVRCPQEGHPRVPEVPVGGTSCLRAGDNRLLHGWAPCVGTVWGHRSPVWGDSRAGRTQRGGGSPPCSPVPPHLLVPCSSPP